MVDTLTLFFYILLFGALAVPGYILGRQGNLQSHSVKDISVILTNIAMPFLVFAKLLECDIKTFLPAELICCLFFPALLAFILSFVSRQLFKKQETKKRVASIFCATFPNCGFLGIPLSAAMFPDDPKVTSLVALYNVTNTFVLLTLGEYIYTEDIKRVKPMKILCKPITTAFVLGVICSYFNIGAQIPALGLYSGILAALTTPLSMLVLGAELFRIKIKVLFSAPSMYASAAIRLLLAPLSACAILCTLKFLFTVPISQELATALMIATGVSTAATATAIAQRFQADSTHAAILVLGSTVLSAITLPCVSLVYNLLF